ncbi:4Fe-4S binding protein [Ferrimonas senticii]|uniref:4Fe-4S binding protein n=1 Tax=Ferrimonas senticii TaxID=394566 RepID=UPI000421FF68|nr:4Fe-4S binding protein [Ferrimonas senticii]
MWLTTLSAAESLALLMALLVGLWALFSGQRRYGAAATLGLGLIAIGLTLSPWLWGTLLLLCIALIAVDYLPIPALLSKLQGPAHKARHWRQYRHYSQLVLALAFGLAALQYVLFVWQLQQGEVTVARPDVVDGFLPLAALLQLKGWAALGIWDSNHPAALVMLLLAFGLSLVVKRSFCGWACPLGWFGEQWYQLRRKLWRFEWQQRWQRQQSRWPKWLQQGARVGVIGLDWTLRLIKYYLLFRAVNMALNGLPDNMLARYLAGYYHKAADLKMFALFIQPSDKTLIGLAVVLLLMALLRGSLCRYLCPFGALMAVAGTASPYKVRRDCSHCLRDSKQLDCQKCSQACPSRIRVHQQRTVWSDECNSCQRCVAACPAKGGLAVSLPQRYAPLTPRAMLLILIGLLFVVPLVLHSLGLWQSELSDELRIKLWRHLQQLPMF